LARRHLPRPGLVLAQRRSGASPARARAPAPSHGLQQSSIRVRIRSRPGLRLHPSQSRSRRSCHRRPRGRIAEQPPLAPPASDPTRLVPVANCRRLSDSRSKAIPGAHLSTLWQTSRQRATTIALGAAPILAVGRLAQQGGGGRAPANPPIWRCHRKCPPRRSPKSSARGGHRRWTPRSKKPASLWRTRQARQKASDGRSPSPDAVNHGGGAVSLGRDDIAEGSSRRRARRSLAADIALSGLTPSDRRPSFTAHLIAG